jgi:hypothetical protein
MQINDSTITATQAASRFAESYSEDGREVGQITYPANVREYGGINFQLKGGARWYQVRILDDYSGWNVSTDS